MWSAASLEAVAVDPGDPVAHRPQPWPGDCARRASLAPPVAPRARSPILGAGASATLVWFFAAAATDGPADHTSERLVAYPAFAVALLLLLGLRARERRAPAADCCARCAPPAAAPGAALDRGVAGPARRVMVLHGLEDRGDRVELSTPARAPEPGAG